MSSKNDRPSRSFEEIVESHDALGHFEYIGQWMPEPELDPDQLWYLDGLVSEERLSELSERFALTEAEAALWRERMIRSAFEDGAGSYMVAVYRIEEGGHVLWGALMHGDHGTVEGSIGPCESEAELHSVLSSSGVYSREEDPPGRNPDDSKAVAPADPIPGRAPDF
jgi:hypothetical protein